VQRTPAFAKLARFCAACLTLRPVAHCRLQIPLLFEGRLRFGREASFLDKRVQKENARARISSYFPRDQKDFPQGRTFFRQRYRLNFFFSISGADCCRRAICTSPAFPQTGGNLFSMIFPAFSMVKR
jgi:hypothetical protein